MARFKLMHGKHSALVASNRKGVAPTRVMLSPGDECELTLDEWKGVRDLNKFEPVSFTEEELAEYGIRVPTITNAGTLTTDPKVEASGDGQSSTEDGDSDESTDDEE